MTPARLYGHLRTDATAPTQAQWTAWREAAFHPPLPPWPYDAPAHLNGTSREEVQLARDFIDRIP